jgi:hypothetical protein
LILILPITPYIYTELRKKISKKFKSKNHLLRRFNQK